MNLLSVLLQLALELHIFLGTARAQSNSSCAAKCPLETTDGWEFIPFTDEYSASGTSCDYNAPCDTQGIGYYICSYSPNGTLASGWGEECGPGNPGRCPATTRVYCSPPPGVSCTVTCPSTDGWGDALVSQESNAADGSSIVCAFTSSVANDNSKCYYYTDTGGLALSDMVDPEGLKTCPISADVACTTSTVTSAPTPTPSTPCAAACPAGGCSVSCPTDDIFGYVLISAGEDDTSWDCLYGFPGGSPRNVCIYDDTGALLGETPWCWPSASIACVASSTPTPTSTA